MTLEYAPRTNIELDYDMAFLYTISLTYNGHKDWRLPTQHEYNYSPQIPEKFWYADPHHWLWDPRPVMPVRTKC